MQCEKFCSYLQQECVGKGVGLEEERPQEQIWPSTVHNGQQLDPEEFWTRIATFCTFQLNIQLVMIKRNWESDWNC